MKKLHTKPKALLIPGGPGLQSSYLQPFRRRLSRFLDAKVVDIEELLKSKNDTYEQLLVRIEQKHRIDSIPQILIGHSFGAHIALSLKARGNICVSKAILLNYLPNGMSSAFQEKRNRIFAGMPPTIRNEREFRSYFNQLMPLYFLRKNDIKKYSAAILKNSFWMKSSGILSGKSSTDPRTLDFNQIFAVSAENDILAGSDQLKELKKTFGNRHFQIDRCGHFSVLEKSLLLSKIVEKITKLM